DDPTAKGSLAIRQPKPSTLDSGGRPDPAAPSRQSKAVRLWSFASAPSAYARRVAHIRIIEPSGFHLRDLRSRTPGCSPFVNSTPAFVRIFSRMAKVLGSPA